jgi:predicted nuclease with TOPRIM domain
MKKYDNQTEYDDQTEYNGQSEYNTQTNYNTQNNYNAQIEFDTLQTEYDTLQTEYATLENENDVLQQNHDTLKIEYDSLKDKYEKLKYEYSENTIIQSMNEMKTRYDRLVQTSVPNHKYSLLSNKYTRIVKYTSACSVILEHISKLTRQAANNIYSIDAKTILAKIENELNMSRDILEDSFVLVNSDNIN